MVFTKIMQYMNAEWRDELSMRDTCSKIDPCDLFISDTRHMNTHETHKRHTWNLSTIDLNYILKSYITLFLFADMINSQQKNKYFYISSLAISTLHLYDPLRMYASWVSHGSL